MAEKKSKDGKRKVSQTVRERTKSSESKSNKRRLRKTAGTVARPVKAGGRGVKKALRRFSFILKPFKTRPVRAVGRILYKVLFLQFIVNSWRELKKVTWTSKRQTASLTVAVFIFAIAFGVVIAITDYGLDKLFRKVLLK